MKCLVSNQARNLWLCLKWVPLLSPNQGHLLHDTFFQEAENSSVYFLKQHAWAVLVWQLVSSKMKKNMHLRSSVLCNCILYSPGKAEQFW